MYSQQPSSLYENFVGAFSAVLSDPRMQELDTVTKIQNLQKLMEVDTPRAWGRDYFPGERAEAERALQFVLQHYGLLELPGSAPTAQLPAQPLVEAQPLFTQMQAELQTQIQSQTQTQTKAEPPLELISPTEVDTNTEGLHSVGRRLEEVLQVLLCKPEDIQQENKNKLVEYVPDESGDWAPKSNTYTFQIPMGLLTQVDYKKFVAQVPTALSVAGLDPTSPAIPDHLPGNKIALHIPRPKEEWRQVYLSTQLKGWKQAKGIFDEAGKLYKAQPQRSRQLYKEGLLKLREAEGVKPYDPLRILHSIDMRGNPVRLLVEAGAIFAGKPGGGKSYGMKVALQDLVWVYPPEWLQLIPVDFKHGVTFRRFESYPHTIFPTFTNQNCVDDEGKVDPQMLVDLFAWLDDEYNRRGKIVAEAGFENHLEYNRKYPNKPIPWTVVAFDEVARVKPVVDRHPSATKGSLWEELLLHAASLYRAMGIVLLLGTQYPKESMGFPPAIRAYMTSSVLYASDSNTAKLVFGDGNNLWTDKASLLSSGGDCIIRNDGKFCHAQTLSMEEGWFDTFASISRFVYNHRPKPFPRKPRSFEGVLAPDFDDLGYIEPDHQPFPNLDEVEEEQQILIRAPQYFKSGPKSINQMIEFVFGEGASSNFRNKNKILRVMKEAGRHDIVGWIENRGGSR